MTERVTCLLTRPLVMGALMSLAVLVAGSGFAQQAVPEAAAGEAVPASAETTTGDGFVMLSNKGGQTIEARILSVSADGKKMSIQLRDGRTTEMAIVLLTLDHQQMVKEWIADAGNRAPSGTTEDFSLTVTMEKKEQSVLRERSEYYRYIGKEVTYEVSVWNRSRQALAGATIEYAVIYRNRVDIYEDKNDPDDDYDYSRNYDEGRSVERDQITLSEPLAYNDTHRFTTKPVRIDEVLGDGNYSYGEDTLYGVMVRVTDALGREIGVYRSAGGDIENMKWSNAVPAETAEVPSAPVMSPAEQFSSTDSVGGMSVRHLDEWPGSFEKLDAIDSGKTPKMEGVPIHVSAVIDIDESAPNGVVVVHGGSTVGYALYIRDGELTFQLRGASGYSSEDPAVKMPIASLPKLEFNLAAEATESTLRLFVEGRKVAEATTTGLLNGHPYKGLSVGFETSGSTLVGRTGGGELFAGAIKNVKVRYGSL